MVIIENEQNNIEISDEIINSINKVCEKSLSMLEYTQDFEISVTFTDNENIQKVNKEFRNINSPTDVLSFPMMSFDENKNPIDTDYDFDGDMPVLGDILINLERATTQAEEYGHSLLREVSFLTAHSMLHLLGYDHMEEKEEKEMFALQKNILEELGINR